MGTTLHDVNLAASLGGGVLIGLAANLLLVGLGRTAGISGIVSSLVFRSDPDQPWRLAFLGGLATVGALAWWAVPERFGRIDAAAPGYGSLVLAGLLVGVGSRLGNGCTSGHGVCGLARLSLRSATAVGVFMSVAVGVVTLVRHV